MTAGISCRAVLLAALIVTGCATTPRGEPLLQRLDETSGATVTTLPAPLSFYRAEPMLAANVRDYVYIGPVEVNRSGHVAYMLWAAYRSTIDRAGGRPVRAPDNAYLLLDGEPMELMRVRGKTLSADWLYDVPVAGGETVLYSVTRAQLRAIAGARALRLLVRRAGRAAVEYTPWREPKANFGHFSSYFDGGPDGRLALVDE